MYRPCRLFPGEVEDYFCMECKIPCSALALLVGPHANHRRQPFESALLTLPQECLADAMELRKCSEIVLTTEGLATYQEIKAERKAAIEAIHDIDAEIARLEKQKSSLRETIENLDDRLDSYNGITKDRVLALTNTAEEQLVTVQMLKEIYIAQELTQDAEAARRELMSGTGNVSTVSIGELKRVEELLSRQLAELHQWLTGGGFDGQAQRHTTAGGGYARGVNDSQARRDSDAQGKHVEEEVLIRHVLLNHERLAQGGTLSPSRHAAHHLPSRDRAAHNASNSSIPAAVLHPTDDAAERRRPFGTPEKRLNYAKYQLYDPDDAGTLAAVLQQRRKTAVSPATTDTEYNSDEAAAEEEAKRRERSPPKRAMTAPRLYPHSPERPAAAPKPSAPYHSPGKATATSGTTGGLNVTVSSTAEGDRTDVTEEGGVPATPKSPSRYLKQYKRVRQCIRDAVVADQQTLVTSLFHAIHELRRDARRNGVKDVEKAIALDTELQNLM